MKFCIRGEDNHSTFYIGRDGTKSIDFSRIIPWSDFDRAHDLVEGFRAHPESRGYIEVVPHPNYSDRSSFFWATIYFLLGSLLGAIIVYTIQF